MTTAEVPESQRQLPRTDDGRLQALEDAAPRLCPSPRWLPGERDGEPAEAPRPESA